MTRNKVWQNLGCCLLLLAAPAAARAQAAPAGAPGPAAAPSAAAATIAPLILPGEPADVLGMELGAAFSRFGPPRALSALRGPEPWQDDVVFSYAGGWSLFWAGDRVWQVRFGSSYAGPVFGLYIGDEVDKAWALLGEPYWRDETSLVWRLPWKGYPVRLRAWIDAGRVADLYVYRADF